MSISLELPRATERVKMKQEGDLVSLYISRVAIWSFIASFSLAIIFLISSAIKLPINLTWLPVAAGIAFFLACIGIAASSLSRGMFLYQKQLKDDAKENARQAIVRQRSLEIKPKFIQWIVDRYAKDNIKNGPLIGQKIVRGANKKSYEIKAKETYLEMRPTEIKFEDLESVYPKNEDDAEIDQKVRERVFDLLEHPDRILRIVEKYKVYTFMDGKRHPGLFQGYKIDHYIEL